jgi:hypothetical protein
MNNMSNPPNVQEMMKVFKIEDSDFPGNYLIVPHTIRALRDAWESIFGDDQIIDDYDCDGDHHVTITHGWISKAEYEALEEWEPG